MRLLEREKNIKIPAKRSGEGRGIKCLILAGGDVYKRQPMASADPASISWMSRPATARGRSPAAVSTEYRPPMEAGTEKVA